MSCDNCTCGKDEEVEEVEVIDEKLVNVKEFFTTDEYKKFLAYVKENNITW